MVYIRLYNISLESHGMFQFVTVTTFRYSGAFYAKTGHGEAIKGEEEGLIC